MAQRYVLGEMASFPPGSRRIVEIGGRSVGIYNVEGRLYAVRSACPHHGAPLCTGEVEGRMLPSRPHEYLYGEENTIIRCPWHGYEFRLEDGRSITDPEGMRVKVYDVVEEDKKLVVYA